MLDLSPAKLLVILIVAVILLGPDKLPQVAKQIGAFWRKLRDFQSRIDQEVRQNIPDLPSSHDIAKFARSPVALLNQLAEMPASDSDELVEDPAASGARAPDGTPWPVDRATAETAWSPPGEPRGPAANGSASTPAEPAPSEGSMAVPDDPSMN